MGWPDGRGNVWPGDGLPDGLRVQTQAIALCRDDKPVGVVVKPQRGGRCLANRTSARRAAARTFPVMVIPIVTEMPLALEPTTRDDFLGSQAAPRPTPVSRVTAAGSRA